MLNCKAANGKTGIVRRTRKGSLVDKAAVKEKLAAARELRGMWANKDTSFFDEKKHTYCP